MASTLSLRTRILIAAVLGLGTFVLLPAGLIASSSGPIQSASCHGDIDAIVPPEASFFTALSRLETAALFPGFSGTATRRANEAVVACTRGLTAACNLKRDAALEQALESLRASGWRTEDPEAPLADAWRDQVDTEARDALCEGWSPWIEFLEDANVPATGLCPVCRNEQDQSAAPSESSEPPV